MRGAIHRIGRNGKAEIVKKKNKWCNKCKENHPVEFFSQDLERSDGLSNKCSKKLRDNYGARIRRNFSK